MSWKEQIKECLEKNRACNLVTRISPQKRDGEVSLERWVIDRQASDFSSRPALRMEKDGAQTALCAGNDRMEGQMGGEKSSSDCREEDGCPSVYFYEPVVGKERLIILGGGHISRCLCEFAAKTGFNPWVVDERPEFANKERFPLARKVICNNFAEALKEIHIGENDYVAILTRGHSCDGDCLFYILTHEMPGYLGMIGSKKRVAAQLSLFEKRGIPREKLDKIHTPIGLSIYAVTPEEIAVSILAELIFEKRRETPGRIQTELTYEVLMEWLLVKRPCAAAVIVAASGSSPRKEGARMLIFEDGSIAGTIGGGLLENRAIEKGRSLIGTGTAILFHFEMDANVAAREGMACGGTVDVLLEDVRY